LAETVGSTGSITVSDQGSQLHLTGTLYEGDGFATMKILNKGSTLIDSSLFLQSGNFLVSGGGTLAASGDLTLGGGDGLGLLTIDSGGMVYARDAHVGESSVGRISIFDHGSILNVDSLDVGSTGSLSIRTGATVLSNTGLIEGAVLVDGEGSSWIVSQRLDIGTVGSGTLILQNSAVVGSALAAPLADITIGHQGQVTVQESAGSALFGNVTDHGSLVLDPSTLNIFGNFTLAADGTLVIDAAGLSADLVGQLNISGSGLFQGIIVFDFIDGFAPRMGDSFNLLTILGGANFSGATFQIEGLESGFQYTDTFSNGSFTLVALNDGESSTSTTPEPSTRWLFVGAFEMMLVAVASKKTLTAYVSKRG